MEIVTYVVNGEVTHKDSHHNQETLGVILINIFFRKVQYSI